MIWRVYRRCDEVAVKGRKSGLTGRRSRPVVCNQRAAWQQAMRDHEVAGGARFVPDAMVIPCKSPSRDGPTDAWKFTDRNFQFPQDFVTRAPKKKAADRHLGAECPARGSSSGESCGDSGKVEGLPGKFQGTTVVSRLENGEKAVDLGLECLIHRGEGGPVHPAEFLARPVEIPIQGCGMGAQVRLHGFAVRSSMLEARVESNGLIGRWMREGLPDAALRTHHAHCNDARRRSNFNVGKGVTLPDLVDQPSGHRKDNKPGKNPKPDQVSNVISH